MPKAEPVTDRGLGAARDTIAAATPFVLGVVG
jgi:hypothetical protein